MNNARSVMERWLHADRTVRICGLDLKPRPHPALPGAVQSIARGQGTVFFLDQPDHGNLWLLKILAPSKRPDDVYLEAVAKHLPGSISFLCAKQRRLLGREHLNWAFSDYRDPELGAHLDGAILMPRVPGRPWSAVADDLRDATLKLDDRARLQMGIALARCVQQMEEAGCAHRDLSAGNVFTGDDQQIYLIDCDCLFHHELTYPANTTAGTNGYIAPFLHRGGAHYDARGSWCAGGDRFALAVLITEFLLVQASTPTHEDGAFLRQQALIDHDASIQTAAEALAVMNPRLARLFGQAIAAQDCDACPSPTQWLSALRFTLRRCQGADHRLRVRCQCASCGCSTWVDEARRRELDRKDRPVLCPPCLRRQLEEHTRQRAQRDSSFPQAACEHCKTVIRLPQVKLQQLRDQGKPVLCHPCLQTQMAAWKTEQIERERDQPRVVCAACRQNFRMPRHKHDHLLAHGKQPLCRDCFASRASRPPSRAAHSWLSHMFTGGHSS